MTRNVQAVKVVALWPKLATNPLSRVHQSLVEQTEHFARSAASRGHVLVVDLKHNELWEATDGAHHHRLCLECGSFVGKKILRTCVLNPSAAVHGIVTLRFCADHPSGFEAWQTEAKA